MRARASRAITLLLLAGLLASSASTVLFSELSTTSEASRVSGRVTVDFLVESIEFGNASVSPENWTQPDKSVIDYLLRGETMPIDITIHQNAGQLGQFAVATVKFEVIHPIGYIETSTTYTEEMTRDQRNTTTVFWTPQATHSELINDELTGGYTLRVSITTGTIDTDVDESNNAMELITPVGLWHDELESGFTSGLTVQAYRYSKDSADGPDAVARGSWQLEDDTGIIGDDSWRHSNPGSNYPSNAFDRLVWGFSTGTSCTTTNGILAVLEQGWDANGQYIWPYCRAQLDGSKYRSVDIATQVWGEMGDGDLAGLELWRPGGTGAQLIYEFENTSTTQSQWTPISWRVTEAEMNKLSWNVGFLFESDNFDATSGYHVDDFAIFAVELVNRFTLDVDCVDAVTATYPDLGFNVIPADPYPPGLVCEVHNNGYRDASVRMKSMNTNGSWLEPRIDHSLGLTYGDDVSVVIEADGNATFWINQTIPPAAEVTDPTDITFWEIEIIGAFDSEPHYEHALPIIVGYHDNARLFPDDPTFSFEIEPGETQSLEMEVTNTGNKHGNFELAGIFPSDRPEWLPWLAVSFTDTNGSELTELYLIKGESADFTMYLTAPSQTTPGEFEVEVQANGVRGTSAQAVFAITIIVDEYHDLQMTAQTNAITGQTDGLQQLIPVTLRNNGNTLESFDLTLLGDAYPLRASLSTSQTVPLDPFGGESGVNVILPMNQTTDEVLIPPGEYALIVTAVSTSDPTYKIEEIISVIITATYSVSVADHDLQGQSYRGGQPEDAIQFRVTNMGNTRDSFEISLDVPDGMNAAVDGLGDSITPEIEPGSYFEVTIAFDFHPLTEGDLQLLVTATSTTDSAISAVGEAVFTVGNLGWVKLLLSAGDDVALSTVEAGKKYHLVISESEELPLTLQIFNKHYESQEVRINFDDETSSGYFNLRVDEFTSSFSIEGNDNRDIALELVIPRSSLLSLPSAEFTVNLTIWVESDLDVAPIELQVTLVRASVVEIEPEGSNVGALIIDGLTYLALLGILGALVFALFRVMSDREEDDDDSGEYEPSLLSHYDGQTAEQALPSASSFLDSLSDVSEWQPPSKDGSEYQPAAAAPPTSTPAAAPVPAPTPVPAAAAPAQPASPATPHTPTAAPATAPTPAAAADHVAAATAGPAVPAEGLPAGWTTEQWQHYGQQWLEQQGRG